MGGHRRQAAGRPRQTTSVAGTGHVSPLLIDHDRIGQLVTEFWGAAVPNA